MVEVACTGLLRLVTCKVISCLARPSSKKAIANNERGLFHKLPEELRLTATIMAMEDAPKTREHNSNAIDAQKNERQTRRDQKTKRV